MIFQRILQAIARLLHRPKGAYYINGPDVLPAPLSKEEEGEALSRLPEDEDARAKLIEHNLRLVVYVARRFEGTGTGLEDLVSIGTVGLIKAINTFRADKNFRKARHASNACFRYGCFFISSVSTLRF